MKNLDQRQISSEIDESGQDIRIDVWLSKRFTYRSRHQWQAIIKDKNILINDKACSASTKLKTGDKVTFIPNKEEPEVNTNFEVVFEDDYLLGINKPGRLPCHPAGPYFKNTLWHLLSQKYENIHLVNRIDRETSGVVIIAKDGKTAGQCVSKIMLKRYTVIVYGEFPDELMAEGFLYENKTISPKNMKKVRKKRYFSEKPPDCECETAKTMFKKLSFTNGLSVLEANLFTGRLHQIRATLCSLGFPVVGDKLYGPDEAIFIRFINDAMTEEDHKKLLISRQALHSTQIILEHPITGKEVEINASLPPDMQNLV
ncbi:MAG: RluA family pseudouridine synthase [Chlorobi bacterium]|nr:RluA family pseudouridine synthase [Chlorobiota bacterium]